MLYITLPKIYKCVHIYISFNCYYTHEIGTVIILWMKVQGAEGFKGSQIEQWSELEIIVQFWTEKGAQGSQGGKARG